MKFRYGAKSAAKTRRSIRRTESRPQSRARAHPILELQSTLGNQAVQRMLRTGMIQTKPKIGQPGDQYEQEADRVTEQVMRMPGPKVMPGASRAPGQPPTIQPLRLEREEEMQRQPIEEEGKKDEQMQMQMQMHTQTGQRSTATPGFQARMTALQNGGRPLVPSQRAFFEPRFGRDFGQVRVHTDAGAAGMAKSINAKAFTIGRSIAFGPGEYAPERTAGRKLLAHELTHVVQQWGGSRRIDHTAGHTEGYDVSRSTLSISRSPESDEKKKLEEKAAALASELQKLIDRAVWKEIRKEVYPKESAAGIKRAKERKTGARPDLTGLGKLSTLKSFAAAIKTLQGGWGPMSADDRVTAIGAAANTELTAAGVPPFRSVAKVKTPWKGFFQAGLWKFSISEDLVNGATLSDADAAELANTTLHEARHAEQNFLSARYSAGPPDNKSAADIAAEQHIPALIATAAVAAKFDAGTDAKVAALGKEMYKAHVTEGAANQKISDDDYTTEMETARVAAVTSLAALKAGATAATIADATAKREKLKLAIAEVWRRYTFYRNIPYEADAHEVGDAAEQAFKGWP